MQRKRMERDIRVSYWWKPMKTKGAGRVVSFRDRENKWRTGVGEEQEQLAGEQRHETTYGQTRNPMSSVSEVQVCLIMLAWTWITCSFSISGTTCCSCGKAKLDSPSLWCCRGWWKSTDVNAGVMVHRLRRGNSREAETILQSRRCWFCFCGHWPVEEAEKALQVVCQQPAVSRRTAPRKISKEQGKSMPGSLCESACLSGSEILNLSGEWACLIYGDLKVYLLLLKPEVWVFRLQRGNSSRYNVKR